MRSKSTKKIGKKVLRAKQKAASYGNEGDGVGNCVAVASDAADGNERRYLETTFRKGKIRDAARTADEVRQLSVEDVDLHLDMVFGRISIRTKRGERVDHVPELPGCGKVAMRILSDLMWSCGVFLSPVDLSKNPKTEQRASDNAFSAHIARLRRAFGESAKSPWLLVSRRSPFGVAWNSERSWRIVERRAGTGDDDRPIQRVL